ncbi:MAG TPA: acyl-CoA dehydrogenase family protein [Ornithinibacter sp.]|nr:acyl-CoA dehydrogenase family protein [Ornithinibacter sp.]
MITSDPWSFDVWGEVSVAGAAHDVAGDVGGSLGLARGLEPLARRTGADSWPVLAALATLGSVDLTTARVVEPHLDAVAVLEQASAPGVPGATWGVYASASPGATLTATPAGDRAWRLDGVKPWCSLADRVSHALVTACVDDRPPGLFAVDLRDAGVAVDAAAWAPRGLLDVTTSTVTFVDVPARPVGEPGWYLERPGFAWGGIGVAAVWFGGAASVAGALWTAARTRHPDQVALMHLGACDTALHGALLALREAARAIDTGEASGAAGRLLAARVRAQVARCAEEVVAGVGHALGPAPLALDPVHAGRVADLTLYLRQHHAERDLAALGRLTAPPTLDHREVTT